MSTYSSSEEVVFLNISRRGCISIFTDTELIGPATLAEHLPISEKQAGSVVSCVSTIGRHRNGSWALYFSKKLNAYLEVQGIPGIPLYFHSDIYTAVLHSTINRLVTLSFFLGNIFWFIIIIFFFMVGKNPLWTTLSR